MSEKNNGGSVVNILLGVLMVIGATIILATPGAGVVMVCLFLSIAMLAGGIAAIIHFIEAKNAEKVAEKAGIPYLATGIGSLVFGIVSVILAILIMTSEARAEFFMKIITVLFGLWIVLSGISRFKTALDIKKLGLPGWLPMIIMSILVIILGIICIVSKFAGLATVDTFYGISMMMFGVMLMMA